MKLEIEITEAEMQSALAKKVSATIAEIANHYPTQEYIKQQVKTNMNSVIETMVQEALSDSDALRQKIASEIERKLRAQLAKAMKESA